MKKIYLVILLVTSFLFIRFYRIDKSLYFYNDMGRDYQVLFNWQQNGKIPFLGPQTSALPINQSPAYFYYLMPFYLITKASPYTSLIASAVLYIVVFLVSLKISRGDKRLNRMVWISFILMTVHPQIILQNRFVWNPSLLPPILILSLLLFFIFIKRDERKYLFWSIFLVSLGISLNYSVAPLLITYLLVLVLNKRKLLLKFGWYSLIIFIGLNLPAIGQVAKRFLATGTLINKAEVFQVGSTLYQKITEFINYVMGINNVWVGGILLGFLLLLGLYLSYFSKSKVTKISAQIFVGTSFLTLLSPFNLQAHYIFAILMSLLVFISSLNLKIKLPIIIILLLFYLQPKLINSYFKNAPRTYDQMDQCFKNFCAEFKQPIFVSVQSDLYPYHFGPEHRYLMAKNGCQVKSIEMGNTEADKMAVILDNGSFSNQTHYYELELFGKFKIDSKLDCQPNFKIVVLSKQIK